MSVTGSGIIFTLLTLPIMLGAGVGWLVGKRAGPTTVRWGQLLLIAIGTSFLHATLAAFVLNGAKLTDYHMLHAFGTDGPRDEIYGQWWLSFLTIGLMACFVFLWVRRRSVLRHLGSGK